MQINKDKVQIKYLLGSYKDEPSYPTLEDLNFDIVNYCNLNSKDTISDLDISKLLKIEEVQDIIGLLQREKIILFDKDLKNKKTYKVIKNPYL